MVLQYSVESNITTARRQVGTEIQMNPEIPFNATTPRRT
jgi:hypothetical protein